MELISSRTNSKVKEARALRQHKARDQSGMFLVEGIHQVGAAIEAGADLLEIFYSPDLLTSQFARQLVETQLARGVPCYGTTPEVFASLADKDNPQGLLAVVKSAPVDLEAMTPSNFPWGVALVAAQDPGNLGAILRTVDAVGAGGLLLLDGGVDAFHPAAVRASLGAIFWRPVAYASFEGFTAWAKRWGYALVGTSAHGSLDFRQMGHFPRPLVLVMGSEREGLSANQAGACQTILRLPMHGHVTSLNLAVATGILLYDILAKSGPQD